VVAKLVQKVVCGMTSQCPICETDCSQFFVTKDYNRKISSEYFRYYRCPDCKIIFLSPIPANLGDYYPKQYYTLPSSMQQFESGAEPECYKIEIVQRFVSKGRLLEIGPSNGNFVLLAKNAGFDVEALEMDESCCQYLNEFVGVKAICSSDPVAALVNAQPYDVIAMWHVIEHLPDQWSTLESIAAKTRSKGVVVIAAPNPDSFQFRIMRRFWPHVDAPRHVVLIPWQILIKRMSQMGFSLLMQTTNDKGGLGWNLFGWEFYFRNYLNSLKFLHPRIVQIAARLVGRLISGILFPIESVNGLGAAYTLVFRKE
jgi:2-polyprenyl-3-methyl-5-hydroxy-6-metoxy-1,4-benzoquinol methylase